MYATFKPQGATFASAEAACDVENFNWQQTVDAFPPPIPSIFQPISGEPLPATPFLDPVEGGYQYPVVCPTNFMDLLQVALGYAPFISTNPSSSARLAYPFYFYTVGPQTDCFSLAAAEKIPDVLEFLDVPQDPCLWGGNPIIQQQICGGKSANSGAALKFTTRLVGVKDGQPVTFSGIDTSFIWFDNYSGQAGGATLEPGGATLGSIQPDDGTGMGGITVASINGVPVTSLPSGGSCNGVFDGTIDGSVTVSANQNCAFTNNCEITGNVTMDGGSLDLECVVDGNLTASGGSLFLGPAAHVKGNFKVSQASGLAIASAAIDGNLSVQNLSGSGQNTVCGTQLKGNLQAQLNASPLKIGGTTAQGCSGNTIAGNLAVSNSTAAVQVDYNRIGGNLTIDGDSGTTDVSGNSIGGSLECQNDSALTYVAANMVQGQHQGQCAALP